MDGMPYNTQMPKLALPEYGRNIQNMVNHCLTIEDREERTNCAYSIIQTMGNLFPHLRDVNDFKHILWDHLAIMSDFKLDIDYPYEIIKEEELYVKPEPMPYPDNHIMYKHYGSSIQNLIGYCRTIEDEDEKMELAILIANQMKKSYFAHNKETEDLKIFKDLRDMSGGEIILDPEKVNLITANEILKGSKSGATTASKKKKK
mgnify:CR=1 FL=1